MKKVLRTKECLGDFSGRRKTPKVAVGFDTEVFDHLKSLASENKTSFGHIVRTCCDIALKDNYKTLVKKL